jgi:4-amino-4-deoxy-L-arabinose transferase-like glycosyltransferase
MKQRNRKQKDNKQNKFKKEGTSYLHWILLICIIAFVIFVRIRLFSTPLERDEGEYAYMGQLLLQGVAPYQEAFNMKLPGTSVIYALFMFLFGQTITAIHLMLLIINVISIVLLFLLTRKWLSSAAGIVTSASFAVFTISHVLLGFAAHATHFVILFTLWGLFMLESALEQKGRTRFVVSGFLFGCAFLMKQPGLFFMFLGISILLFNHFTGKLNGKEIHRVGSFLLAGFFLPLAFVLAIIIWCGTFDRFWFWVVQYAFEYSIVLPFHEGYVRLIRMVEAFWDFFPFFCILIGLGFIFVVTGRCNKYTTGILLLFFVFSVFAVLPGWYFRNHYFILIAPICSMLVGAVYYFFQIRIQRYSHWKYMLPLLFLVVFGENLYSREYYYFKASPANIVETVYNGIFPESIVIGNFLSSHTAPTDRIAILGSEPQIYFYAKRRSVSGHIYMYGLMEQQPYARKMQEELIADVERAKPKYIVFYEIPTSWNATFDSELHIAHWVKEYTHEHYSPVGLIDIVPHLDVNHHVSYDTRYVFGEEVEKTEPRSRDAIIIYERNDRKQ